MKVVLLLLIRMFPFQYQVPPWLQSLRMQAKRSWMVPAWSIGHDIIIRHTYNFTLSVTHSQYITSTFKQYFGICSSESLICFLFSPILCLGCHGSKTLLLSTHSGYRTACAWWLVSSTWAQTSHGAASPWWWSTSGQATLPGLQCARRGASLTSVSPLMSQEEVRTIHAVQQSCLTLTKCLFSSRGGRRCVVPGEPCTLCAVGDRGAPELTAAAADTRVMVCLY